MTRKYPSDYWAETEFGLIYNGRIESRVGWNEAVSMCSKISADYRDLVEVVAFYPERSGNVSHPD